MSIIEAIYKRRSIRKFKAAPIPRADIEKIILAGMQAPSPKNRQPWRFVVVEGAARTNMVEAMRSGLERESVSPRLPQSAVHLPAAKHTVSVMENAPVTIFVVNPLNSIGDFPDSWDARFSELANVQSVGACIQNMLLAAGELGYGSLWICDIDFAYDEVSQWLRTNEQILAAVSFGAPDQSPSANARPRKKIGELVEWK